MPQFFLRSSWLLLLSMLLLVTTACKDKDKDDPKPGPDLEAPRITVIAPQDGHKHAAGQVLEIRVNFSDNRALSQYKIDIHDAFDGHSHKTGGGNEWKWDTIVDISGTEHAAVLRVIVPESAPSGPYHLLIYCYDQAGNGAGTNDFKLIELMITSPSAPEITDVKVDGEVPGDEVDVAFGATDQLINIQVTASIADADGLDHVKLKLVKHDHAHSHKQASGAHDHEEIWEWKVELSGATTYSLNQTIPFERSKLAHDKHYELIIEAKDEKSNHAYKEIEFHVKFQ